MKTGTYGEYEEKKVWIQDYLKKWEKLRGSEHWLIEEDKELTRRPLMESLRLH